MAAFFLSHCIVYALSCLKVGLSVFEPLSIHFPGTTGVTRLKTAVGFIGCFGVNGSRWVHRTGGDSIRTKGRFVICKRTVDTDSSFVFNQLGRIEGNKETAQHNFLKVLVVFEFADQYRLFGREMADAEMEAALSFFVEVWPLLK